jgi:uncharacterized protein YjbJ (UPF0337 family)
LQSEKVNPRGKDAGEQQKPNKNMSTLAAKGNWNIAKGKLKQTFARLMEDDLQFFEGKVDELVGRIQKRAGLREKAPQNEANNSIV